MRTMTQVWIIVFLPFVGLVIITSLVVALLGLGNYRYDTDSNSHFINSTCFVISATVQPFSHVNPGYTFNCGPTIINCFEAFWQVKYNDGVDGQIFSSGKTKGEAFALASTYQANYTYNCWYLRSDGIVSWEDWSPTERDQQRDVRMMRISFGLAAGGAVLLLALLIGYFNINSNSNTNNTGPSEQRPFKLIGGAGDSNNSYKSLLPSSPSS